MRNKCTARGYAFSTGTVALRQKDKLINHFRQDNLPYRRNNSPLDSNFHHVLIEIFKIVIEFYLQSTFSGITVRPSNCHRLMCEGNRSRYNSYTLSGAPGRDHYYLPRNTRIIPGSPVCAWSRNADEQHRGAWLSSLAPSPIRLSVYHNQDYDETKRISLDLLKQHWTDLDAGFIFSIQYHSLRHLLMSLNLVALPTLSYLYIF